MHGGWVLHMQQMCWTKKKGAMRKHLKSEITATTLAVVVVENKLDQLNKRLANMKAELAKLDAHSPKSE